MFLLRHPSSLFWGCCGFGLRFLRPCRLSVGRHYRLLRSLLDRQFRGINIWVGVCSLSGFDNTHPSDDVLPPLTQVHLLGRGTGPLGFRNGKLTCGDSLPAALGLLLCKSRLLFLPLYTDTVFRCVVSIATRALRLFPRGRAATGEVEAFTNDAPGCVSAVTLRVAEALAALILQRAIWRHVRIH